MRNDILISVSNAAKLANVHVNKFKVYEHIWLDDKKEHLEQFLKYGRQLLAEEIQQMEASEEFKVKEIKPTLEMFKKQVFTIKRYC